MKTDRNIIEKIEARELAEHLLGGLIVGERGFNGRLVSANKPAGCSCLKPAVSYRNALEPARLDVLVPDVFGDAANAKIGAAIIETIAADVIDRLPISGPRQQAMQENTRPVFVTPFRDAVGDIDNIITPLCVPPIFVHKIQVSFINQRHVPTSQRHLDDIHGWHP